LLDGKLSSYTFFVDAVPGASLIVTVAQAEQIATWERNLSAARFI
jgi:hypothetical protein